LASVDEGFDLAEVPGHGGAGLVTPPNNGEEICPPSYLGGVLRERLGRNEAGSMARHYVPQSVVEQDERDSESRGSAEEKTYI